MGPAPVMVRTPSASSFQLALSPHLPLSTKAEPVQWSAAFSSGSLRSATEMAAHSAAVPP